ncbi:MAG: hypothetical protein KAY24_04680 [Candidatus Eisenbacteria sp.]|nr:hypothetical protein [Candidatus Eisenbacteria bacterium]
MSVGIAVAFDRGALLVADGRSVTPLAPGNDVQNDAIKLHELPGAFGAVVFGIQQASDLAVPYLRNRIGGIRTLAALEAAVRDATQAAWSCFAAHLAPDVDRSHPAMRVALVVGGLIGAKPVLAGAIASDGGPASTSGEGPGSYIVLGGEDQDAMARFARLTANTFHRRNRLENPGDERQLIEALVHNAEAVIREVENFNPTVGGIIHYAVVGRGSFRVITLP